jgi:hypothetical protein
MPSLLLDSNLVLILDSPFSEAGNLRPMGFFIAGGILSGLDTRAVSELLALPEACYPSTLRQFFIEVLRP